MSASSFPLFEGHDSDQAFIWHQGQPVSRRRFWAQAQQLAGQLPSAVAAINLCDNRYHFLLGFVALILRDQINLLPPDRAPHTLQHLAREYPDCYCLVDAEQPGLGLPQWSVCPVGTGEQGHEERWVPVQQRVATVFTSGSTGHSLPQHKSWAELYLGARQNLLALGLQEDACLLATVPAQHMYGLELSVLLPLLGGLAVDTRRPFFPADLQQALAELPTPRYLISTPLHLRTCLQAQLAWPSLHGIVSATAPLEAHLARELEQAFACPLWEIYGSSESGAIATRRTAEAGPWQLHTGVRLRREQQGGWTVQGGHLDSPRVLNDRLRLDEGSGQFWLAGREGDLLKLAGKRASLSDLNRQLLAVAGVEDGVFVPSEDGERLCALVVAPGLDRQAILAALAERVDPVFLPRPLYLLEKLPRNDTGKLPREVLSRLVAELKKDPSQRAR